MAEWMASEMTATDPMTMPTTNLKTMSTLLEPIDRAATAIFFLAVCALASEVTTVTFRPIP
jgi:hypothetical protein